ncbi:MAG: hypothetical protein WCG78_04920, partial [Candidatus Omnitrophota bacterium]
MNKNICERIERYAIIGIAFFLPLSSGAVNTLIAIGIGFWLLGKILRKEARLAPTGMNLLFLLFFIACSLSFIHSVDARTSLQGLVKVLKYFGIFFLLAEGVRDLKTLK